MIGNVDRGPARPRIRADRACYYALVLLVAISSTGAPQAGESVRVDKVSGESLYRNVRHKFRIRFPSGWLVKDGDGPNVQKKALSRGATVLVVVRDLTAPDGIAHFQMLMRKEGVTVSPREAAQLLRETMDYRQLSESDYPESTDGLQGYSDVEIVESGMRKLDNRAAKYVRARMTYSAAGVTVRMEQLSYILFLNGKLYNVIGGAPISDINERRAEIERSIRTFVIENW